MFTTTVVVVSLAVATLAQQQKRSDADASMVKQRVCPEVKCTPRNCDNADNAERCAAANAKFVEECTARKEQVRVPLFNSRAQSNNNP